MARRRDDDDTDHGWVIPRPDGRLSKCGGPLARCKICLAQLTRLPHSQRTAWYVVRGLTEESLDTPEDYPLGKHSE